MIASVLSFAQKKEISTAFKAFENNNYSEAISKINEAENILGGKTSLLEPSLLEKYYFTKGASLFKTGKKQEAISLFSKLNNLSSATVYSGKDGKNRVYFIGKEEAKASGISDLKESTYTPEYLTKVREMITPELTSVNNAATEAYNNKKYDVAATKFEELYHLLKILGQDNKMFLYYSAVSYSLANKKNEAIAIYKNLIESNYTGVETSFFAKNKKTGKEENLDKNSWTLLKQSNNQDYSDFRTEQSKSIEGELYENLISLLLETEKYDDAVLYANKGLQKFPKNAKLNDQKGIAYFKSGKTEEFVQSLKESISKNPNNKEAYYNLGVILSKDPAKKSEAIEYFKKSVSIDPNFSNAWQNLVFITIGDDEKVINEYNALRKAKKIDEANKIIEARRKTLAEALPYAEKWYESDKTNIEAVSQLKGLYISLRNEAKAKEFKALEEALSNKK